MWYTVPQNTYKELYCYEHWDPPINDLCSQPYNEREKESVNIHDELLREVFYLLVPLYECCTQHTSMRGVMMCNKSFWSSVEGDADHIVHAELFIHLPRKCEHANTKVTNE